jgi:hypothetical protein
MADRHASWRPGQHEHPASGQQPLPVPDASGLGGTGLVADDLYLLAHGDRTGRPLLARRALGIGLAGGLLAELMLGGGISLRGDGSVAAHRSWPADDLARRVRDQVAAEREPRPLREWLLFFARTAAADVARRLEQAGYLRHVRSWIPGRPGRWVPVNADWAFAPVVRVHSTLDPAAPSILVRQPWPGWSGPAGRVSVSPRPAPPGGLRCQTGSQPARPGTAPPDRPDPGDRRQRRALASHLNSHNNSPDSRRCADAQHASPCQTPARYRGRWPGTGSACPPCCSSSWPASPR